MFVLQLLFFFLANSFTSCFCFLFSFGASLMLTSRRKRRNPFSLSLIQVLHLSPPLSVELSYIFNGWWKDSGSSDWLWGKVFFSFSPVKAKNKKAHFTFKQSAGGPLLAPGAQRGNTYLPCTLTHTGPHPFTPRRWKTGSETEHNRHQQPLKVYWAPCFSIKNV